MPKHSKYLLKLPDLPYVEDRQMYDYLMSLSEILKSVEQSLQDINTRLQQAGV